MFENVHIPLILLCLNVYIKIVNGWSTESFEIYDLVEEIDGSFYDLFQVSSNAEASLIRKAYRRLSLQWHPDRNPSPDSAVQFRKIAAVYEVLKSVEKRRIYDDVLINGLPDWRQPMYYYRRALKLSWWEAILLLMIILTVGHYIILWSIYAERFLIMSSSRLKKSEIRQMKRQGVTDIDKKQNEKIAEQLVDLRPTWKDLLLISILNYFYTNLRANFDEWIHPKEVPTEKQLDYKSIRPSVKCEQNYVYELAMDMKPVVTNISHGHNGCNDGNESSKNEIMSIDEEWTREEVNRLVELCLKYPQGTANRYNIIAKILRRTPKEIGKKVASMKKVEKVRTDYSYELNGNEFVEDSSLLRNYDKDENDRSEMTFESKKYSMFADPNHGLQTYVNSTDVWTASDQKKFEAALTQFPLHISDRWDRIADYMSNKTKQQCKLRYKEIRDMVLKRRTPSKIIPNDDVDCSKYSLKVNI